MSDDRETQGTPQRVPPHNIEAERSVLGAALLAESAAVEACTLSFSDLYRPAHGHVLEAIKTLIADGVPVDTVTVSEALRRAGQLDQVGGVEFLNELQNDTPSVSGAGYYAEIVREAADRRRLILAGAKLVDEGYDGHDVSSALLQSTRLLGDIIAGRAGGPGSRSTLEWLDPADVLGGLEPEEPMLLMRTDGACLMYAGKLHSFQAESTTGKTWVVLVACLQIIAMGGTVIYIDYEDTGRGIIRRCQELGQTIDADFLARFRYVSAPGRYGVDEAADIAAALDELNPDLVVVDGVGESMARAGLNEDSAGEFLQWLDMLPRAVTRRGPAVAMIDHVKKDPDTRGRYARGTGAKLGALDGVAFNMVNRVPFSRHKAGHSDIVIDKDRPGGVGAIRETVARVHFEPHAGGERLVVRVEPYTAELAPTDAWRPTFIMEKVSREIEGAATPMTATQVRALVHVDKAAHLKEAISRLIAEGFIEQRGRPAALHSVRPFRAAWHDGPNEGGAPAPSSAPIDPPARLFPVPEMDPEFDEDHRQAMDHLSRIDQEESDTE